AVFAYPASSAHASPFATHPSKPAVRAIPACRWPSARASVPCPYVDQPAIAQPLARRLGPIAPISLRFPSTSAEWSSCTYTHENPAVLAAARSSPGNDERERTNTPSRRQSASIADAGIGGGVPAGGSIRASLTTCWPIRLEQVVRRSPRSSASTFARSVGPT